MRPVLARTSSAASGLRFCGMIEEPVVNWSDSATRPTSGEHQITISSAKRDRCTAVIAAADSASSTKSRSETASSEFAIGSLEAERLRGHVAIDRESGAGERRGAERRLVRPLARIREPATVARSHLHIGQQVVAEGHRLGDLQMGKARHHGSGMLQRLLRERALISAQGLVDGIDRFPDPKPEIGRDLIVARARSVQPPRRRADQLGEPALHVHMDVFERALELELAALDL